MKLFSKAFSIVTNTYFYKLIMIIIAFLYVFPYTMSLASQGLKYFLIWGFIIVVVTYFKDKSFFMNKTNWFLIAFLLLSLIGVISNLKNNFIRNIFDWCYLIVFCLAFIYVDKSKNKESICKEVYGISILIIFISFFVSFVSFILYLFNLKSGVIVNGQGYLFGTYENRLFGVLGNPNSGALLSLISIFISCIIILYRKNENDKKPIKSFMFFIRFNIILQFIVLFLSNSRSAMVALCTSSAILIFILCRKILYSKIKNVVLQIITAILLVCIGCSAIYGVSILSNKIVGYFPVGISFVKYEIHKDNGSNKKSEENLEATDNERIYKTKDVSNGRFDIWMADLKVTQKYIFTGVGNANVVNEVNKYLLKKAEIASNTHNIYLQILVSSGIFPLIFILIYFIKVLITGFLKIYQSIIYSNDNSINIKWAYCFLFGLILALLVENLFDSNIIGFMNLLIVPIFWIYLGYAVDFINREENFPNCEEDIIPNQ